MSLTGISTFVLSFGSEFPLIPGRRGRATRWSSSRRPWLEVMILKNASASAPVAKSHELFLGHVTDMKHILDPRALCAISDLLAHYLKSFHCVWAWPVCFCLVVKSSAAHPYVRLVHDLSYSETCPAQREGPAETFWERKDMSSGTSHKLGKKRLTGLKIISMK